MPANAPVELRRTLGFWALLAYGVGDMLGAGIYALVGKVAGFSGTWSWVSFGIAMLAASLIAMIYAELATRYPRSGGAAHYCEMAFRKPMLSILVGWLVLCSGLVSMAASSQAFSGYLTELVAVPNKVAIALFLLAIAVITYRGIGESSAANIVCTLIELTGLLIVIVTGLYLVFGESSPSDRLPDTVISPQTITWIMILQGAGVAFYACIGFEDMANVAEEVKDPVRTIPMALLTAIAAVAVCYMLVAYLATATVHPKVLNESNAPLVTVIKRTAPWAPKELFTGIAMFAVANTSLLNCVMASRLLHGMSREGLLPQWLGHVHPVRQTPYRASLLIVLIALVMSMLSTITRLANTTSLLLLTVFIIVAVALLILKRRGDAHDGFTVPWPVPVLGIMICATLIAFSQLAAIYMAAAIAAIGIAIAYVGARAAPRSGGQK